MEIVFAGVMYLTVGGVVTALVAMSDVFTEVAESDEAASALGALSVLLWPLWGFALLAGIAVGLHHIGCGFVDLFRQLFPEKEEAALPKATARKAGS